MDSIVLNALEGLLEWLPLSGLGGKEVLPFHNFSKDVLMTTTTPIEGTGMPHLEAVLFTSWFCLVLTAFLMILWGMIPMSELELILDVASTDGHIDTLKSHKKSLEKVTVKAFDHFEEEELAPIFQTLAELPDLKTVVADLRVPFSVLSILVEGAQKLRDLSLHFQLKDSDGDIQPLVNAIQKHPSLTSMTIESSFYDSKLDKKLDPLLETLADKSSLQTLALYNLQSSSEVFTKIFQSSNLQALELSNIPSLTGRQVEFLAGNPALRTLIAPLRRETQAAWGKFLERNTALQKLMLVLEDRQAITHEQDDAFLPVAQALGRNKTLASLALDVNEHLTPSSSSDEKTLGPSLQCMQAIATSISQNSVLKILQIGHCSDSFRQDGRAIQGLVQAVQKNYTLERMELRTGSCCSRRLDVPEIDFYLQCNQRGRGNILRSRSDNRAQVASFVIQHRADVSIVFHMLLEKPELMQTAYAF